MTRWNDKDELVVVDWTWNLPRAGSSAQTDPSGSAEYMVFKGMSLSPSTRLEQGTVHGRLGLKTVSLVQAAVSAGDLDGDHLDEIAFTGIAMSQKKSRLIIC